MVAGREVTPQERAATERLMRYWAHGPGAAKIKWGVPGDFLFDRCVVQLSKYVGPNVVKGLCSNLHVRALGVRPGQEHGGRKRGKD